MPTIDDAMPYLRRIDEAQLYSNYGPIDAERRARIGQISRAEGVSLTSSGTSALELALRAVAWTGRRADEPAPLCLMPSYTFATTAHAVMNAGMVPHFIDMDSEDFVLTRAIIDRVLPTLPRLPAAILVVSAFGAPVDIDSWARFGHEGFAAVLQPWAEDGVLER